MSSALERLKTRLGEAKDLLQRAERAGMEVGADQVALHKAQDQLVEARVLAHSFDEGKFQAAVREGVDSAELGILAGHRAFAELGRRRTGLLVSLGAILAVIVALVLKVRQIESRSPP